MKIVNGFTVYEGDDKTALDEYSAQLAVELKNALDNEETDIQENQNNIEILQQDLEKAQTNCKEFKIDMENTLPTVKGTGTDIELNGTSEARIVDSIVGGNTEQDSYEGKNLLNRFGKDVTNGYENKKYLTTDGSTLSNNNTDISEYIPIKGSTNYILGIYNANQTVSFDSTFCLAWYNSSKEFISTDNYDGIFSTSTAKFYKNYISPQNASYVRVSWYVQTNYGLWQLKEGTTTSQDDYESYVGGTASPNPEYPQEIKNVGSNVNLFNKDTSILNTSINASGVETNTNEFSASDFIKVTPNQTYNINGNNIVDNFYTMRIHGYNSNKEWVLQIKTITEQSNQNYNDTIDIPNNIEYLRISYPTSNTNIQIKKGTTRTPYTPYNYGGIDFKVSNKNLFDKNNIIRGYELESATGNAIVSSIHYVSNYIKVTENTNYYMSGTKTEGSSNCFYDENKNFISTVTARTGLITSPANSKYMRCNGKLTELDDIQLEEGSAQTSFIEHKEQNITIPINFELCKIGDYKDYIYKNRVNGKWYLHKEIKKVVFDGSNEDWGRVNNSYRIDAPDIITINPNNKNILSNYYSAISYNSNWDTTKNWISVHGGNKQIVISNNEIATTADFKTWLSTYNTIVYYILKTPIETEITDQLTIDGLNKLDNVLMYKEYTKIECIDDIKPILTVEAYKSLKEIYERLESIESRLALVE